MIRRNVKSCQFDLPILPPALSRSLLPSRAEPGTPTSAAVIVIGVAFASPIAWTGFFARSSLRVKGLRTKRYGRSRDRRETESVDEFFVHDYLRAEVNGIGQRTIAARSV